MAVAAELIQPRVDLWLHPHHLEEVGVSEGAPLQLDGRKEEQEEGVAFLVQPDVADLGGEFESSETQEEGVVPLPPIHQTRDGS